MENPFVLPKSAYKRDLRPLQCYVQDAAAYINKMTGAPLDQCVAFVKKTVQPGSSSPHAIKDPTVTYAERQPNGDRIKKEGKLSTYLTEAIRAGELIAPTFTTYLNPKEKKSLLVDFIDGNVAKRSKAKKEMFAAERAGNKFMRMLKKIEQTGWKLGNNALSGAHVSASTPLTNKTAHSTLTSNCRTTSGYGNANNEKFLCGNRHYWSPDIVRNNLISILNHTDYPVQATAMAKFGIRPPSAEETMECILHSTKLYWRDKKTHRELEKLVSSMSDAERCAFVYTGDLFHLRKHNEELVRNFITRLSARVVPDQPVVQSLPWKLKDGQSGQCISALLERYPEDQQHLASSICSVELRGVDKLEDLVGTPVIDIYCATLRNIFTTIQDYRDLIRAFWVTENVPASLSYFPDSIRRAAITSDTDSTIFTVQEWVIWHENGLRFTQHACGVAGVMIFLAAQTITHVLARMSANFGIEESRLFQVAMKNEYYFPVFVPTQVAKHYYALISVQEGIVKKEFEKEIKGVHLKSSNAPPAVMKKASELMEFIMTTVYEEKYLSIVEILKKIARIEHEVMASIRKGSTEFFRKGQVKTPDSYAEGEDAAAYQQYLMWQEVFAPKYGLTTTPPYMSVKVSADLNTPSKVREWLANLKDQEFVARVTTYMERTGRKHLGTAFMMPEPIIASSGLPEEILDAIGTRKIVLDTTKVFYVILESLGIFMLNNRSTRLVSDEISAEEAMA